MKRTIPMTNLVALACFIAVVTPRAATAGDEEKELKLKSWGDVEKAQLYVYDTAVPAAPALGMVTDAPELTFTAPFGPDLSSDVVLTGDKPGAAFAARPYWALGLGKKLSTDDYKTIGWLKRVGARTSVSGALAPKVANQEKGLGAAIGVSTELLDSADPRLNAAHLDCLRDAVKVVSEGRSKIRERINTDPAEVAAAKVHARDVLDLDPLPQAAENASTVFGVRNGLARDTERKIITDWLDDRVAALAADRETDFKAEVTACFETAKKAAENSISLQVASGVAWSAPTYTISDLASNGPRAWAALRLPLTIGKPIGTAGGCLSKTGEAAAAEGEAAARKTPKCERPLLNITAFAQYVGDAKVTVAEDEREARTTQFGLVLSHGAADKTWSISGSAVWNERDYKSPAFATDRFQRYSVSLARKVVGSVWTELTIGQTEGIATAKEESYGLVRFVVR